MTFRTQYDLQHRSQEATRIRKTYPDRLPLIVEPGESCKLPKIDKRKYLVPPDLTVGQFIYVIRKRIKLSSAEAVYLFVNDNTLLPSCDLMQNVYNMYKNEDGFLYFTYHGESTFGSIFL